MSPIFFLWVGIGAATGVSHATALWRTARRVDRGLWGIWRLPLVAVTLVSAALAGRLLPAAIGWVAGLLIGGVIFLVSQRQWK